MRRRTAAAAAAGAAAAWLGRPEGTTTTTTSTTTATAAVPNDIGRTTRRRGGVECARVIFSRAPPRTYKFYQNPLYAHTRMVYTRSYQWPPYIRVRLRGLVGRERRRCAVRPDQVEFAVLYVFFGKFCVKTICPKTTRPGWRRNTWRDVLQTLPHKFPPGRLVPLLPFRRYAAAAARPDRRSFRRRRLRGADRESGTTNRLCCGVGWTVSSSPHSRSHSYYSYYYFLFRKSVLHNVNIPAVCAARAVYDIWIIPIRLNTHTRARTEMYIYLEETVE